MRIAAGLVLSLGLALSLGASGGCATGDPSASTDAGPLFAPGADAGPGRSGECGFVATPCCGGFCNPGLSCNPAADRCEAVACGADGQDCCEDGPQCQGTLTCLVSGLCASMGPVDGCGMRGAACCASDPPCGSGLACAAGVCEDAPACGASGQACCMGSMCNTGMSCQGGACLPAVTPMCVADGGACAANGDCCNSSCMSGVCRTGATGGGGGMPACNTFGSCGSCTDTPHCMWCDGSCEPYFTGGKVVCAAYPFQC